MKLDEPPMKIEYDSTIDVLFIEKSICHNDSLVTQELMNGVILETTYEMNRFAGLRIYQFSQQRENLCDRILHSLREQNKVLEDRGLYWENNLVADQKAILSELKTLFKAGLCDKIEQAAQRIKHRYNEQYI